MSIQLLTLFVELEVLIKLNKDRAELARSFVYKENGMKESKRQQALTWLAGHPVSWQCLHCDQPLQLLGQRLTCNNGHSFDLSRQGYVNLAKNNHPSQYDQTLFNLRRRIILESPFYQALHQALLTIIKERPVTHLLDAGCGEGSHLYRLSQFLEPTLSLIGVDLAKEGIQLATDFNQSQFSVVADLAQIPFQENSFDLVLSILSPANYEEFNRVLKTTGRLIKVIPNTRYLIELRSAIANLLEQAEVEYSNEDVEQVFRHHYIKVEDHDVYQKLALSENQRRQLIHMTPLTWRLTTKQKEELFNQLPTTISLDLRVLVAEKVNFLG